MKIREIVLLTFLISLIPFAIYFLSASQDIGDLGSLIGASSGMIAVIWFYRGLRLQSFQIEEQRIQFSKQHHIQYQDSSLTFLLNASERIEKSYKELSIALNLSDSKQLSTTYLDSMKYYKEALESTDPNVVISNIEEWMKIEGPCVKFMSSVKDIITLHKRRLGIADDGDEKDVADYVFINSSHLLQQPFMSYYQVTVKLLSEQMSVLTPGRKALVLASITAMALLAPEGIMKKDKIIEQIETGRSQKRPIPKICEQLK
ncbi:MAG: hypothetical protein GY707_14330 [Desulfobacteraceae bacterium]|nr:hypothetical protein [Desulfobacteraceae bacterium]